MAIRRDPMFQQVLRLQAKLTAAWSRPDGELRWIQEFVARDIRTPADMLETKFGLAAVRAQHLRAWAVEVSFAVKNEPEISDDDVRFVQGQLDAIIGGLNVGATVRLERPIGDALFWSEERGPYLVSTSGPAKQIIASVIDLLVTIGPKLRRCEGCGRLFTATRPKSKWCSPQCGGRIRSANWRKLNPERAAEIRHQVYVRQVKRRAPRVRVHRRRKA